MKRNNRTGSKSGKPIPKGKERPNTSDYVILEQRKRAIESYSKMHKDRKGENCQEGALFDGALEVMRTLEDMAANESAEFQNRALATGIAFADTMYAMQMKMLVNMEPKAKVPALESSSHSTSPSSSSSSSDISDNEIERNPNK